MKGKIFSIEEFSTFDGPGIRMSVFLKGCPLRCTWCHNPEGQSTQSEYIRKNGDCRKCGKCLENAEKIGETLRLTEASASACPQGLIRVCGEDYTAEALCERILKNKRVLDMSGGGVTFSGGEPLMQASFLGECLSALRPQMHCAIQTCGYADGETFGQILTMCDYVLFDLKLMDSRQHKRFCGADNEKILKNYDALTHSGVPFVTRIPLIPAVTDTKENIRAIAEFVEGHGVDYVEVLPYNKMAGGKYAGLLRQYTPGFDESVASEPHIEIFNQYGINVRSL